MKELRIAVATDDGKTFVGRHFGDAKFYDIYEISSDALVYLQRVPNEVEEEVGHADPVKARGIAAILKAEGVQVALTKKYGPNIKRIKTQFVCVMTAHQEITDGLALVQQNFADVKREWEKGTERSPMDLRSH